QRLKLHYVDWGNAERRALLLLHGGRDHCRSWDWVAADLRRDFHLIAPDLRGHGDSAWAVGSTYSMIDYVLDLAALLKTLDLFPIHHHRPLAGRARGSPVRRHLPRPRRPSGGDRRPRPPGGLDEAA